ncbi:ABC transporter substrate-binding protein [Staphylococcus condimenti]|uniref:ABC transporter substrate-binding protein n=1 Tax=Staphylococcus condimenti TaxID=70255 RepID=A0AB37HB90_9STAP|nr:MULTISPECIES: ABC transporter substrate-binding protein [Staphylococcus]AMY06049.1 ABC transporter substrate-binding protein [Staphylococcus condimenti]APR59926.1 ABC transporter substrate-binding protein [Staphylococcus condimenti]MDK8646191.1 ABC transporter substrate-binding protein [Staphylococcus condimenti]OFO99837.1 ABC transporter substrate-binding protein [Staphylococcus sp. HMSC065E08]PNZ59412.1 ABC transporter substrate-binding protein [Staphylococcus condimenti]
MKRLIQFGVILMALVMVLAGCQNKPEGEDKKSSSDSSSSSNSKDKLVLYTAGPDDLVKDMVKEYEKESGKKVEVYQGTTGEILGRLEAEKDNPKADVVQLASLPAALDYKKKGLIEPYKVKSADKLYRDWQDKDGYWYGFSGSALGISYNTDKVKEAPTDVKDLLKKDYKDALAIPNPSESGTALDLLAIKVHNQGQAAWDEYKALKDNGMKLAGANKPALETVIKGENKAVYGGVDYMVYKAKKKGEPVDISYPKSGTSISPRPAFILKSAKHKDAAKDYMNYVTSDKGQKQVDAHYLIPANKDEHKNKMTKAREDIKELKYDWPSLSSESEKVLKKFMDMMKS